MQGSKIVDARVIVTCPGRNFVTLKILTSDGLYGVGDGTLKTFNVPANCPSQKFFRVSTP